MVESLDQGPSPTVAEPETTPQSFVLVVGENQAGIDGIRAGLQRLGYGTPMASDRREAMELIDSYGDSVALLLVDADLPDHSATALLEELASRNSRPDIALIGTTPLAGPDRELLEHDAIRWIDRPFTFGELSRKLADVIPPLRGRWS
jgi:CheY-like chemotaxis protein